MKRIICLAMALILAISLVACNGDSTSDKSEVTNSTDSNSETTVSDDSNSTEASNAPVDEDGLVHIKTPEDMAAYAKRVNDGEKELNAILDADIDMSAICGSSSTSWTPIKGMSGSFEGAGHTISNLYCVQSKSCALFYDLSGTVSNLTLKNTVVESTEKSAAGIAVEISKNAVISNCTVGGTITGYEYAGGIAVYVGNGCSITNCVNESAVKAGYYNSKKNSYKGASAGIVARACGESEAAKITNCVNKGTVTGTGSTSGGIVGTCEQGNNLIEDCTNQGKVEGVYYVGGIAGYANPYTVLNRCINDGALLGTNISENSISGGGSSVCVVAGIAPFSDNVIINCANHGNAQVTGGGEVYGITRNARVGLVNCYNTGDLTSDNLACGVGYSPSAMQANVYNYGSVICTANTGVITDCFPWTNGGDKGLLNAWAKENCIVVPDDFKDKKPSSIQDSCATPESSFTDGTVLNALNEAVTNLNGGSFDSYEGITSILNKFAEKCDVKLSKWVAGKNGLPAFDWE